MHKSSIKISRLDQVELNRRLILAIENTKYDEVVKLLNLRANITTSDQDGDTSLHCAVTNGDEDIIELLIQNKANVNARGRENNTPLNYTGDVEIARKLINHKASVSVQDEHGYMPLHYAIIEDDIEMMALLIKSKANMNAQNQYGYTPLHFASIREISEYLIKNKADVNAQNADGATPLHTAVCRGNIEVIESLIRHNTNVNTEDVGGHSAFYYSAKPEIIHKLLELVGDAD